MLGDVVVDALRKLPTTSSCACTIVYFEAGPRLLAVANMARALRQGGVFDPAPIGWCRDRASRCSGSSTCSELFDRFDPQYVYQKD
ncbi:MAG: hypothetical protein U1E76_19290 [Planctomycetota bacterium]